MKTGKHAGISAHAVIACLTAMAVLCTLTACDGTGGAQQPEDTAIYVSGNDQVALYQQNMAKYFHCMTVDANALSAESFTVPEGVKTILWLTSLSVPDVIYMTPGINLVSIFERGDTVHIVIETIKDGSETINSFDFVPQDKADIARWIDSIGAEIHRKLPR